MAKQKKTKADYLRDLEDLHREGKQGVSRIEAPWGRQ
jgi:hypothetical protein